jgi:hypothetical protein
VLQMQLMQINDSLATVVQDALLREIDPNRSPSPPPRYDGMGKRTNTREMRMRESLINDRIRIIEDLIKINPLYQVRMLKIYYIWLVHALIRLLLSSHPQILLKQSLIEKFIFPSKKILIIIL